MLLWLNGSKIPAARLVLQQINGLSFGIIVLHKVIAVVYFTLSDSAFFLQISGWLYRFVSRGVTMPKCWKTSSRQCGGNVWISTYIRPLCLEQAKGTGWHGNAQPGLSGRMLCNTRECSSKTLNAVNSLSSLNHEVIILPNATIKQN